MFKAELEIHGTLKQSFSSYHLCLPCLCVRAYVAYLIGCALKGELQPVIGQVKVEMNFERSAWWQFRAARNVKESA